ncbi:MAG: proton-conducting transporter membrane subunit, partial [Candidatus Cloacimonadaceae bacterium]|nr:proton-conducting transporter membrane subunit [Candidatus Cloacimonadaceae bacterium]
MISAVFAFIMFTGVMLPWLLERNRRLTVYFIGSISVLLGLYFLWLASIKLPIAELIGSKDAALGITLSLGARELFWLLATLGLITIHFIIYHREFTELSLTTLVLYLFSFFAICGILLTRDIFNLFVMLELFSISMIGLILARVNHINALKAFQYLLLNSLAAALFLLGVVLIYQQTGTLNLDALLAMDQYLPNLAMAFVMTAISLKLMLFPLN